MSNKKKSVKIYKPSFSFASSACDLALKISEKLSFFSSFETVKIITDDRVKVYVKGILTNSFLTDFIRVINAFETLSVNDVILSWSVVSENDSPVVIIDIY